MGKAKITLDDIGISLVINSIAVALESDRFTEDEKDMLEKLKKRLREMK